MHGLPIGDALVDLRYHPASGIAKYRRDEPVNQAGKSGRNQSRANLESVALMPGIGLADAAGMFKKQLLQVQDFPPTPPIASG